MLLGAIIISLVIAAMCGALVMVIIIVIGLKYLEGLNKDLTVDEKNERMARAEHETDLFDAILR